jgi:Ca-activated chloride channel family protein
MELSAQRRTHRPCDDRGISRPTGGRAIFPDSVYELEDICTKIAVELKNQYVLGFHSTNGAKDGKWRKLRVKVNPPKGIEHLNVRAKSGYYAATADAALTSKD